MMRLEQIKRLLHITRVFVRHDLDEFVLALHLFRPYRHLLRLSPWNWLPRTRLPRAVRLRQALEELGPIFVKFGQMVSTRPDLLPEDIALELSKLQDQVPPFPGEIAVTVIEQAYGGKLEDYFIEFDPSPIASASVAQVHFAKLKDGTEVAVKILRPNVEFIIDHDVSLLYTLAKLALRYWPDSRRLRPIELVEEYNKIIHGEIDLMSEAANASQLRANFTGSDLLYVPKIFWDYTRRTVMVMERVSGIPISDIEALKAAGVDMRRLAHNGVEIFFTQAFRDGFFHADMHPGNIFVSPEGQYRAVDFGIMGTLSDEDKYYLARNFLGFFNRDYRAIAAAHLNAGWAPATTRVDEFEAAIRAVCEPIFAKPLKDISFGKLLLRLFQTARRFNIEIQPQLALLQKTLFNIEGLGRRLYPELDLWITAKPFLERWMREQLGPRAWLRSLRQEIPRWAKILPEFPGMLYETLRKTQTGGLIEPEKSQEIRKLRREMRYYHRRLVFAIAGSSLFISATVILALRDVTWTAFAGVPALSWLFAGAGSVFFMLAWPSKK
jgi:ubiquinone biosynthesis protein